jgi:hypothetical protein
MKKILCFAAAVAIVAGGCNHNPSGPMGGSSGNAGGVAVSVIASPTGQVSSVQSLRTSLPASVLATVDSITIHGATLVIEKIAFTSDVDTVHTMDSSEVEKDDEDSDHHGDDGESHHIRFRGPFLVQLQNNTPVLVALDTIPPGTYNGIRFVIHKLRQMDVMKNPLLPDSLVGYSIVVTGSVKYPDSPFVPFVFKTNINEEFKVKGNFVVLPGDKNVPYALNFNIGAWFKDSSGRTLDPNNMMDRFRIRQMIRAALGGHMKGGRDDDHDGEAD